MRITAVMSHSVSYVININFYGVARFAHCLALPVPPLYILLGLDLYIFIIGSRDSRVYALISSIRSLYTEARIQDFGKGVGEHGEYVTGGGSTGFFSWNSV